MGQHIKGIALSLKSSDHKTHEDYVLNFQNRRKDRLEFKSRIYIEANDQNIQNEEI